MHRIGKDLFCLLLQNKICQQGIFYLATDTFGKVCEAKRIVQENG